MRKFKWTGLASLPFNLCVGFLMLLGKVSGLTYMQISVVFNLWVQGIALVLSAILPAVLSLYMLCSGFSVMKLLLFCLLVVHVLIYVWAFYLMLKRYHLPFNHAFVRCVHDLRELAKYFHTTYEMVNLLIFVVAFLFFMFLNLSISYVIYQLCE